MKKTIINVLVIFFVAFAILLAVTEVSKTNKEQNQVTQSYDFDE